jgi:cyclophilin family peptidyl-prolyl cis-trans isomerase
MSKKGNALATKAFLELDIDHHREKYERAKQFVAAKHKIYSLSSSSISSLSEEELKSIPELYSEDHEFKGNGDILLTPPSYRIEFDLFAAECPKTVENFAALCAGDRGEGKQSKKKLHFKNCMFHRIIPGFMCQTGDFVKHNGSAGESIYGGKFNDEKSGLSMSHDGPGILSMANGGKKNDNGSQFFITFTPQKQLDGKHVVFGRVSKLDQCKEKSFFEVLKAIEACGSPSGVPTKSVEIIDCGVC